MSLICLFLLRRPDRTPSHAHFIADQSNEEEVTDRKLSSVTFYMQIENVFYFFRFSVEAANCYIHDWLIDWLIELQLKNLDLVFFLIDYQNSWWLI